MDFAPSVYICLDGNTVITGAIYKKINKGNYFYLPYVAEGKFNFSTETKVTIIECLSSKQK